MDFYCLLDTLFQLDETFLKNELTIFVALHRQLTSGCFCLLIGCWDSDLTRLLSYVATHSTRHSKEHNKSLRTSFDQFLGEAKDQVTGGHQRSNLAYFNIFRQTAHNSETRRGKVPQKNAFDSSLNVLTAISLKLSYYLSQ